MEKIQGMKRIIKVIALCIFMLFLSGSSFIEHTNESDDYFWVYRKFLAEHKRILIDPTYTKDKWEWGHGYMEQFMPSKASDVYYSVKDLTGDGKPALMLGALYENECRTFAIFTDDGIKYGYYAMSKEYGMEIYENGIIEDILSEDKKYRSYYQYVDGEYQKISEEDFIKNGKKKEKLEWKRVIDFDEVLKTGRILTVPECEKPEIEIVSDWSIEVKINSQKAYENFLCSLKAYKEYSILYLDMQGTDTVVYLDEILSEKNFAILEIRNGGIVSSKENVTYENGSQESLYFDHVFQIEKFDVEKFTDLRQLTIRMDAGMKITDDFKEIFHNDSCKNIVVLWDDEIELSNIFEDRYFKAFYKLNEGEISYVSSEFCDCTSDHTPYVVIEAANKKTDGVERLEIPQKTLLRPHRFFSGDGQRLHLEDINFDGYRDIIFLGYNDGLELYHECVVFLWEPAEKRFKLSETAPFYFDFVDAKRKRVIYSCGSGSEDSYFIYEFRDGIFHEKRMEYVDYVNERDLYEVKWEYFEDGKYMKKMILSYGEEGDRHYEFYEADGSIIEGELEEEIFIQDLGKKYFPEFDFYRNG